MTPIHQPAGSRRCKAIFQCCRMNVEGAARAIFVLTILALLTALAAAQSTSSLNGSVTDASGAAVSGAKIVLTETATGLARTTTSNASGLYQFLDVPPGDYRLEANAKGFAPFLASNLTLLVKVPATVPIRFQVAGTQESVTVEGQAPLINRTDASLGNVLEGNQVAELPIADRNVSPTSCSMALV